MGRKALLLIVILGGLLRLVWLDKFPAGFTADEASFGYNAYSLLKTGRDEWGAPWYRLIPDNLRSSGDDRFPLYAFLTVPTIKIFGLNEFAIRLPNAVMGTLSIVTIYLLAGKLFAKRYSLYAAILMAISPWHISLSRGAFETNTLTTLIPLGMYLMLTRKFVWAAVILGINTYSYIAARILTIPLIVITGVFAKVPKSDWIKFAIVFLAITGPAYLHMMSQGNNRVADVGIFNPTDNWGGVASRRFEARIAGLPDGIARIFSNKAIYLVSNSLNNYLTYLSPQFLFTSGAGEPNYGVMPGRGLLYYFELPLLLIFVWLLIKNPSKVHYFILLVLLISPIPAALTKGPGMAANRAATMIPFLVLASAFSFQKILKYQRLKIVMVLFIVVSMAFFLEDYYFHSARIFGPSRNYGYREAFLRAKPMLDTYPDVRLSRSLSSPHIFAAFYWQIDPSFYQKESQKWVDFDKKYKFLDQMDGYTLGKFRFGDIHPTDRVDHPTLYIGRRDEFPLSFPEYFHIDDPTGAVSVIVAEKKP